MSPTKNNPRTAPLRRKEPVLSEKANGSIHEIYGRAEFLVKKVKVRLVYLGLIPNVCFVNTDLLAYRNRICHISMKCIAISPHHDLWSGLEDTVN